MDNLDLLWAEVCKLFPFVNTEDFSGSVKYRKKDLKQLAEELRDQNSYCFVEDIVLNRVEDHIRQHIVPNFWKSLIQQQGLLEGFETFKNAVQILYSDYELLLSTVGCLSFMRSCLNISKIIYGESDLVQLLKLMLRTALHSQIPPSTQLTLIEDFYSVSFKTFYNSDNFMKDFNESGENILQCRGCSAEIESCRCKSIMDEFNETNRILIMLDLLECMAGHILTKVIQNQVESHVRDTCKGSFDVSHLSSLEYWLNTVVVGWLTRLYESALYDDSKTNTFNTFKRKLQHLLYETYTKTRIEQLFNIIIEYPESDPAIGDLRICLEKTDLRGFLTSKLKQTLVTRLLHPGVSTPDIITAFSSSIRALRQLDPTGVLLETVTEPIRQYLRCRDDTVKCVMMSLTEEGPGELAEQLDREDTEETEIMNWQTWQPDPIDAVNSQTNKNSWDIISMLVNVYGSKDLFINEYKNLLADRLLSQYSYNTEKEFRYLELLKLRFGDSQLYFCDVMLKDMYDSKRISSHLFSDDNFGLSQQPISCTAMIVSAQFWPPFKEEIPLEVPSIIKELFEMYTKAFESFKVNRTLIWKPHLGFVDLDIELKGRVINLTVNPIQATIIWHFQEKEQWTIEELSSVLHVAPTVLRRRISFWQSQGILKEVCTDTFLLIEDSAGRSCRVIAPAEVCEDDEAESIMVSAQEQREEDLQVSWSYIVGMLTNLDSLSLERIHQMLKMFASQGPSSIECTLPQLKFFLDRKVREHKLLFSDGLYKLQK